MSHTEAYKLFPDISTVSTVSTDLTQVTSDLIDLPDPPHFRGPAQTSAHATDTNNKENQRLQRQSTI